MRAACSSMPHSGGRAEWGGADLGRRGVKVLGESGELLARRDLLLQVLPSELPRPHLRKLRLRAAPARTQSVRAS